MFKVKNFVILYFFLFYIQVGNFADTIIYPKIQDYYSVNGKIKFQVVPPKIVNIKNFDPFTDSAKGILFIEDEKKWTKELVNKFSPKYVLISKKAGYIVTFGDWFKSNGTSDNLIVIYNKFGRLLYKLTMLDIFSDREISQIVQNDQYPDIHWNGENFLDEEKNRLVLNTCLGKKQISLKTGKLIDNMGKHIDFCKVKIIIKFYISNKKDLYLFYKYIDKWELDKKAYFPALKFKATDQTSISFYGSKFLFTKLLDDLKNAKWKFNIIK